MTTNSILDPLDKTYLPEGANIITFTWACKKESNSTCHKRVNARGFEKIAGKHFDSASTVAPVTNDKTIRIVLELMILVDWTARIYDMKGCS